MMRKRGGRSQYPAVLALLMVPLASVCLGDGAPAGGEAGEQLAAGVRYVHEVRGEPAMSLHVVRVDLTDPKVAVRVVPGGAEDPDGPGGRWETTLLPVTKVAEREGFDVAVNGDYFQAEQVVDANTAAGLAALAAGTYRTGQRARVVGPAVTDGRQWAMGVGGSRPALMMGRDGKASMGELGKASADVVQAVGGSFFLVRGGVASTAGGGERNARTAVGLDRAGRTLTIVVVDGLWNGRASGIGLPELARELVRLGCYDAISLDGGGSSTLVMREGGEGKWRVVNHPTDGKPRAVANVLGVRVKKEG